MSWQIALLLARRRQRRRAAAATLTVLVAAGLGGLLLLGGISAGVSGSSASSSQQDVDCPVAGITLTQLQLDAAQSADATTIVTVGQQQNIPTKGLVVAIAGALQESSLRNLAPGQGDRDSIGLFQMRPSQDWGTTAQLEDPTYQATKFYSVLTAIANWQSLSVNDAAQAVLRSGHPLAYGPHEQEATQIVAAITAAGTGGASAPPATGCTSPGQVASGPVGTMVQAAVAQIGKPYVWGATGPDSFDCSGLVVYAWRQAGYQLTVRTSEEMYNVAVPVPAGQEQPGDLIFSNWGEDGVPGPGHVQIVVTPGTLVEAPRPGLDVRETPYSDSESGVTFGRLPSSAMTPLSTAG